MKLKREGTPKQDINMKKLFRRNQIIITTLAIMIAAAGYLNYAGKRDLAASTGEDIYQAGTFDISEEDLLAENQKKGQEDTATGGRNKASGGSIAGWKLSGRGRCGNGPGCD